MPRTFLMTCDRHLSDKVTPGNRVKIVGILSIMNKSGGGDANAKRIAGSSIKQSYLRVVGLQSQNNKDGLNTTGFSLPNITQEDEERINNLGKDPLVYEKISKSIASAIYGHTDIKKAITCLLFGGSPKKLPDGMRLRGDINVLLLGDPSTAKS